VTIVERTEKAMGEVQHIGTPAGRRPEVQRYGLNEDATFDLVQHIKNVDAAIREAFVATLNQLRDAGLDEFVESTWFESCTSDGQYLLIQIGVGNEYRVEVEIDTIKWTCQVVNGINTVRTS
jgi:hypothetical protein